MSERVRVACRSTRRVANGAVAEITGEKYPLRFASSMAGQGRQVVFDSYWEGNDEEPGVEIDAQVGTQEGSADHAKELDFDRSSSMVSRSLQVPR